MKIEFIVKKFTSSQKNVDKMLDGIGNHVNRQGLDLVNNPPNLKRHMLRRMANFVDSSFYSHDVNLHDYYNDDVFYDNVYTKSTCHYCNVKGHFSFDCYACFYPKHFVWVPKVKAHTNTSGSKTWLPMVHLLL